MLKRENNYDFKKELLCVHKRNVRNVDATAEENEFVFADGVRVVLSETDNAVMMTAA